MRIKYQLDKHTRRLSLIITLVLVVALTALALLLADAYLRAWLIGLLLAIILLFVLSIPRYISLVEDTLEIHCVVELTRIQLEDIRSARTVSRSELSPLIPLLGSYGFFGYYGYYIDLRHWDVIKVYATQWNNLVLIEDIYETKYLVSCSDPDNLIGSITG